MLSTFLLSFLSVFLAVPNASSGLGNISSTHNIINYADDDDEDDDDYYHGYTYQVFKEGDNIIYSFDSRELGAKIDKLFCAPAGYKYFIKLSPEQALEISEQMDFLGDDLNMTNIILKYEINGSMVSYSDAYFPCDGTIEGMANNLSYIIDGSSLLEMSTIDFDAKIASIIEVKIDTNIFIRFYGEAIEIRPFDETDFVNLTILHVDNSHSRPEARFGATVIEDFFDETPNYNPYGYKTDTTLPYYDDVKGEDGYVASYKLTLIGYDSIPLGDLGNGTYSSNKGIVISIPDEPMYVKAQLKFTSSGKEYTFYSKSITIEDLNIHVLIDDYENRANVPSNSDHIFRINSEKLYINEIDSLKTSLEIIPDRLYDEKHGYELYGDVTLPTTGDPDKYYYEPSELEKDLYNSGHIEELNSMSYQGTYKIWDEGEQKYVPFGGIHVFEFDFTPEEFAELSEEEIKDCFEGIASIPFAGRWKFKVSMTISYPSLKEEEYSYVYYFSDSQMLEAVDTDSLGIHINTNVPDSFNLISGAGEIDIIPEVSETFATKDFYYDWEMSRKGVIEMTEDFSGKVTINPINPGLVVLKVVCESQYFSKLTKLINIRVLDGVYDSAKVVAPDGFHYANNDLTLSLDVRGFTRFLNLNVKWSVVDKKGKDLAETKYVDNKDATLTLVKPESNDYTVKASYEGILLDKVTLEVRKVNMDAFLATHIWWIVLITIGLCVLLFFFNKLTKIGRTTVQHIERVYGTFCSYLSDDKLTKNELKHICRDISRCLHRCEDLNIEAFNQYEKSIRYLRKSLNDAKTLYANWDKTSLEERGVYIERLNADLSKALIVAKEIESAKQLVDQYHFEANHHNYETLDDGKKKRK